MTRQENIFFMKILISRTDRIGDLILSLPIAHSLKKEFGNDVNITYLVSDYTKDILMNNPNIDKIITADVGSSMRGEVRNFSELFFAIKKIKPEVAIVVYPRISIALLLKFAGIEKIIGTSKRIYSFLFTHRVSQERKKAEKHEVEYNLELLKPLNINPTMEHPKIYITEEEREEGEKFWEGINNGGKVKVIVHPFSKASAFSPPKHYYEKLIEELSKNRFSIAVIGRTTEKFNLGIPNVLNLTNRLSLRETIKFISSCDVFISSSTGPTHIAASLNKSLLSFYPSFGPTSFKRWGPLCDRKKIFIVNKQEDLPPLEEVIEEIKKLKT